MKVATFNANSIRSRMEVILEWIARHQPDAFCVQETKVQDPDFPLAAFESAGLQVAFKGEKAYNGVAVITRGEPPVVRQIGFDDGGPKDEARLLWVQWRNVHIVNTYVPQGREIEHAMYAYKLEWFQRLRRFFDLHFTHKDALLWVGDLNVAAEPIDVHDPDAYERHVCFHTDVRAAFAECCAWGFVDVFRKHHPEPGHFTFFDYRTPNAVRRGLGWRLDYLLASPTLAARSTDCEIDLEPRRAARASDHTVVAATFEDDR